MSVEEYITMHGPLNVKNDRTYFIVHDKYLLRVYSFEILLMMDSGPVRTCRVFYQINLRNSASRRLSL
jgi:hypothetical protein